MANKLKHWKLETDDDGVVWCHFDKQKASANVLSSDVFDEFESILDKLESEPAKGLIILSDKQSGFIAGANVEEFATVKDEVDALEVIHRGQAALDRLEELAFPTLSMIHGFCLGGGLELALACDYRIAMDDPKTRLGLPEVRLGIHPGFGGTMRLIRLIGAPPAMDLMLSGRTVNARVAKKLGIVDKVVPLRQFKRAAKSLIEKQPEKHSPKPIQKIANQSWARPLLAKYLQKQVSKKASQDHYPAPYALIDLWREHVDDDKEMLQEEANSVARLITGDTAQNLVRVFLLQEQLKELGKNSKFEAKHVHVIGAGIMGGDIAAWCALRGLQVTLQDMEAKFIAPAIKRAHTLFKRRLKDPRLVQAAMDRLLPDQNGVGVKNADVIIEAIVENLEIKQNLFKSLEAEIKEGAVLATNTSSIPLDELVKPLAKPERLVGIHFFNPVAMMQLVEIINSDITDQREVEKAAAFCRGIDRLPLSVKSSPGFLVNRILMPYLLEAVVIHSEGVPAKLIDDAAVGFGMPMGPVKLADKVGLDICLSVAEILGNALGKEVPEILRSKVSKGHLGVKSGRGFYQYKKGKIQYDKNDQMDSIPEDISDRLSLQIINESVACIREGIINSDDHLDAGMIFGTGFAPFRGGPMNYMKQTGKEELLQRLQGLNDKLGERFQPDAGWENLD